MSSYVTYVSDGLTASYSVPFPVLNVAHLYVTVNGVPATYDAQYDYDGTTVTFRPSSMPGPGQEVEIRRQTPTETPLVVYQPGSVLTADDLNTATKQAIYAAQEVRDYYEYMLVGGFGRLTGGTYVSVEQAIDAAVQQVLNSQALAALQAMGSDINANSEAILANSVSINQIAQAQAAAAYVQTTAPVPGVGGIPNPIPEGARWYDSDDNNKLYLYLSGVWTDVSDPRIAQHSVDITNLQSATTDPVTGLAATASALDLVETLVYDAGQGNVSLANKLSKIGALSGDGLAFIIDTTTARVDASTTLAAKFTSIETSIGGNTASINTQQSTLNGVLARYGVRLNVNGHVSGFIANNDGVTSDFIIQADKFAVVTSDGVTTKVPFVISGGVCYMQNVVIQDALIQNLTVGKLTSGTFTNTFTNNGDFNVGTTGKVRGGKTAYGSGTGFYLGYSGGAYVFDIGNTSKYLRWTGSGLAIAGADITLTGSGYVRYLGTNINSTYIDWYGPTGVTVNDANADFYIKKSGGAYFGGDLWSGFRPRAWARFYTNLSTNVGYFTRQLGFASITRIAQGRYQFTFSTAMPNRLYTVIANCSNENNIDAGLICAPYDVQTTGFKLAMQNPGGNYRDTNLGQLIVFGSDEVETAPPSGYDYTTDPSPPTYGGVIP